MLIILRMHTPDKAKIPIGQAEKTQEWLFSFRCETSSEQGNDAPPVLCDFRQRITLGYRTSPTSPALSNTMTLHIERNLDTFVENSRFAAQILGILRLLNG